MGMAWEEAGTGRKAKSPFGKKPMEQRDRVICELLKMKKTYGDFIANTRQELCLMKSENYKAIVKDCPFRRIGGSFDPLGRRKLPCAVGPGADCRRCGCILQAFARILSKRRFMIHALWDGIRLKTGAMKRIAFWAATGARLTWIPILIVALLPAKPVLSKPTLILLLIFVSYMFASIS
jgi:hypothetical protein